jgi:hypothetical protein
VNKQNLFSRPAGSFLNLSHGINQPLDQAIQTGVSTLFFSTPFLVWQPRVSLAYQIKTGTVVHLGFGVFNYIIPAQIADLGAMNAPYAPIFAGGIGGRVGGLAIATGVANSAAGAALSADQQFQSLLPIRNRIVSAIKQKPCESSVLSIAGRRRRWPTITQLQNRFGETSDRAIEAILLAGMRN